MSTTHLAIPRAPARRPSAHAWPVATVLALLAFAGAWWLLGVLLDNGYYGYLVIPDTPVYRDFGDRVVLGGVPYRDVPVEYPPAAIPVFLLPYLLGVPPGNMDAYDSMFEVVMFLVGLGAVVAVALSLRASGVGRRHMVVALGLVAASPVLLGPIVLSRYDLWPAALTAGVVAALLWDRYRVAAILLGIAVMAKVYPVVILPILLAWVWRRHGQREAVKAAALTVGTVLAILLPFLLIAPEGVTAALARQLERPLQVESLGAATLFALRAVNGMGLVIETSYGSQNLAGPIPDLLAGILSVVQVIALVGVWAWFFRGPAIPRRLVVAVAAAVVAYTAFGKVLSPQYVMWLVPLVPLVAGRRGLVAAGWLVVALLLTQSYFPSRYFGLVDGTDATVAWPVLFRDLALVAIFATLVAPSGSVSETIVTARERASRIIAGVRPLQGLAVVVVGAVLLRVVWLAEPPGSLIFDEAYYVNAARTILGWGVPADAPYATAVHGLDPNTEHPPLGKVLIAGSMLAFGDNGLGWRLPSVVAGLVASLALYGIVRRSDAGPWLAVLVVAVFSLDILSFVHSRIGTLDMLALAAMLVGSWLGLARRPVLAGIAFAVACLFKITAVFGFLAYLVVELMPLIRRYRAGERLGVREIQAPLIASAAAGLVGLSGLWLLDVTFTAFSTPLEHVGHMLGYGMALQGGATPDGIASQPWDWIFNAGGFDYLRVDVNTMAGEEIVASHPTIHFQALLNPVLVGIAALAVPFGAVRGWRHGDALARWAFVWVAANFLPFVALAILSERIMYFYYILPVVPGLAALTVVFLMRADLPRAVVWAYLVALLVAYVAYFPFRTIP